jgi:tRNA-2-methylthio-N6-dimethylallyladenosine synthase
MREGLILAHAEVEKLMPFLHLPVQSGSDRILKAMNRSHSRDSYLRILDRVRAARPDIALSGDFIVGFPGETDADFEDTLSLVDEAAMPRRSASNTAPAPAPPRPRWTGRSLPR